MQDRRHEDQDTTEAACTPAARRAARGQPEAPVPAQRDCAGLADVDAYIKDLVDNAPPLTDRQRDVLALLFSVRRDGSGRRH